MGVRADPSRALSDAQLYAARASHISGHWIGDKLVAITSVNVPGFLPGAGFSAQHADGLWNWWLALPPPRSARSCSPSTRSTSSTVSPPLTPSATST